MIIACIRTKVSNLSAQRSYNDNIELRYSIFLRILSRSVSLLTVQVQWKCQFFTNDIYIYIYIY